MPLSIVGPDTTDAWTARAVVLVEHAIDQLVLEFVELPFLHRVEHSLHCELYALLTGNRTLGRPYEFADGLRSQLVHKEWPEPRPRPEKAGRRGNLDLAVLHPDSLRRANLDQFRQGRVDPIIAIEIGLNYPLRHLEDDAAKLMNSAAPHSYLVHLVNDESAGANAIEEYLTGCPVSVAYAWASPNRNFVKLVGDSASRPVST